VVAKHEPQPSKLKKGWELLKIRSGEEYAALFTIQQRISEEKDVIGIG